MHFLQPINLHPTEPWILESLYSGSVCIWNYQTQPNAPLRELPSPLPCSSQAPVWPPPLSPASFVSQRSPRVALASSATLGSFFRPNPPPYAAVGNNLQCPSTKLRWSWRPWQRPSPTAAQATYSQARSSTNTATHHSRDLPTAFAL